MAKQLEFMEWRGAAQREGLRGKFLVPPFSVLDARQGYWQDRKREWIALGIRGEEGRVGGNNVNHCALDAPKVFGSEKTKDAFNGGVYAKECEVPGAMNEYYKKKEAGDMFNSGKPGDLGKQYGGICGQKDGKEWGEEFNGGDAWRGSGTSVFDPVLCELMYRWFNVPGGTVLDPFAGESTKGIVAEFLGYPYTGIELRQEQCEANEKQALVVGVTPRWIQGDSAHLGDLVRDSVGNGYDFIFTSPPYYDLEVYSEKGADGSAKESYPEFMAWYLYIFSQAVRHLKENRFLAVKVGEIRERDGNGGVYRNFIGDNISCFTQLGLHYYNELILVTSCGSLPIRVGGQFSKNRKIGKTHQQLLVFYKGDPSKIAEHFPENILPGELI